MSQTVIARRYAKALLNLAEKENKLEAIGEHLSRMASTFAESNDLQKAIADTKVPVESKKNILKEVSKHLELGPTVTTFVQFLLHKKRIVLLPDIETVFSRLLREKLGKLDADVTVAKALTKDQEASITKQLSEFSGKDVQVNVTVDEDIIGGVITRIGSTVIDGSLRNQLTLVYQSIIRG